MKKRVVSEKKKLRLDVETLRKLQDGEAEAANGGLDSGAACETHWWTCVGC